MSSSPSGTNTLAALRSKMQSLKDDTDKAKEQYEQKCKDLEREKTLREQVGGCVACYWGKFMWDLTFYERYKNVRGILNGLIGHAVSLN